MNGEELLRKLRRIQLFIGALVVLMVVVMGDLINPFLDRNLGVVGSDVVEGLFIALVLYVAGRPQMRELQRAIVELDALRDKFYGEFDS